MNATERVLAHATAIVARPATSTLETAAELHRWGAAYELLSATSGGARRTDLALAFARADSRCPQPALQGPVPGPLPEPLAEPAPS